MRNKNESFAEKCKAGSRDVFIKIGNMAVGNVAGDEPRKGYTNPVPFSWRPHWAYEKPMPKRKSK